jgi:hypothetical protein
MTESNHPVLLIGDRGVGKSALINDRLKATCGGDISDDFYITINCNSFVFLLNKFIIFNSPKFLVKPMVYLLMKNSKNNFNGSIHLIIQQKETEKCFVLLIILILQRSFFFSFS